jgi:DNA (cytosine-5)-methyltransferase 1
MKPRLLDLFSCAGGAGVGYARAGFDVVGVDKDRQPNYPYEHHVSDALAYLRDHGREFDAIHASPPCQRYTSGASITGTRSKHPDLVDPTRDALEDLGKPYVIENVVGSPLRDYVQLCGSEFGLVIVEDDGLPTQLRRHRWFESNRFLMGAGGCNHVAGIRTGSVFGNGGAWQVSPGFADRGGYRPPYSSWGRLLGIDWMTKQRELAESIPPAYTEFLGRQLLEQL